MKEDRADMNDLAKDNSANIILTGFMGTGKSTIGRLLASRLGRPFIDMDAFIEVRERVSIAQIFSEKGERYFRSLESALCKELAAKHSLVIATGGGTLTTDENLIAMQQSGIVICLDANETALWQRLADQSDDRPMLSGKDKFREIQKLYAMRKPAYDNILAHIDTSHLDPSEVVDAVMQLISPTDS
jgi:shikimate kinase